MPALGKMPTKGGKPRSQVLTAFALLVRRHPAQMVLTVLLLLSSSIFEGVGIAVLVPLLDTIGGTSETPNRITEWITGLLSALELAPTLLTLIVVLVVLVFLKSVFSFLANTIVGSVAASLEAGFRNRIVATMMRARWNYFVSLPNGRIASAMGSEANVATGCYIAITKFLASLTQVLVQLTVALLISWQVALGSIVVGGLIALFGSRLVRLSRAAAQRRKDGVEELSTRILEAMGGMKALKGMGAEDRMVPLLKWEIGTIRSATKSMIVLGAIIKAIPEPVAAIVVGIALYFYVQIAGEQLESFLVLALLLSRLVQSATALQHNYQRIVSCEPSFWFLEDIIAQSEQQREPAAGGRTVGLEKDIRFENVSFDYGDNRVLGDVDLTFPAGSITALAGLSGAGKTTIADLVAALHHPSAGRILVDGVPMSEIDRQSWREGIGYVLQDTFLFHESIKRNVTLGDPDLTDADAEAALRQAGIWDFVAGLPEGPDTVVGERGARLSGGQRQRIAIARALIRKPKLLILDEPTAGLDRQTEDEICETLSALKGQVTTIAVSHQPALFDIADNIYMVSDGQISRMPPAGKESGTGDDVLSQVAGIAHDGTNG